MSIIKLKNIHKSYVMGSNKLHVLKGIDLELEKGEMVSIMGSSGSGKSTLLNIIGLLDNHDEGGYWLNGIEMKGLSETKAAQLRNQYIGFVFQSFNLISFKNAMENVAMPLYYQKVSRRKRNLKAMEYLEKMGLKEWAEHLPNELSGGQKQRIAIARALIGNRCTRFADFTRSDGHFEGNQRFGNHHSHRNSRKRYCSPHQPDYQAQRRHYRIERKKR